MGAIVLGAIYLLRRGRNTAPPAGPYDDQTKGYDAKMEAPAYYSPRATSPRSWAHEPPVDRYSGVAVHEVQPGVRSEMPSGGFRSPEQMHQTPPMSERISAV